MMSSDFRLVGRKHACYLGCCGVSEFNYSFNKHLLSSGLESDIVVGAGVTNTFMYTVIGQSITENTVVRASNLQAWLGY